jgi:hypothetical protein
MGADVDHRAGEISILHARHGNEKLAIEEAAFSFVFHGRQGHHSSFCQTALGPDTMSMSQCHGSIN